MPIFTQIGVNGDFDRRYVDIGSKHLKLIDQEFANLKNKDNIFVSELDIKNEDPSLIRYIQFGPNRQTAGQQRQSQAYRGYLMVAPESIYPALQRVNYVGKKKT